METWMTYWTHFHVERLNAFVALGEEKQIENIFPKASLSSRGSSGTCRNSYRLYHVTIKEVIPCAFLFLSWSIQLDRVSRPLTRLVDDSKLILVSIATSGNFPFVQDHFRSIRIVAFNCFFLQLYCMDMWGYLGIEILI